MSPTASTSRLTRETLRLGLSGGFVHLALVSLLWSGFEFTTRLDGIALFFVYLAIGALVVGAVPVALLRAQRLVSPFLVVAGSLTASAFVNWSTYVAPSSSPTPVGPTPFGWYLLAWPGVLAVALLVGGIEYALRRRGGKKQAEVDSASP